MKNTLTNIPKNIKKIIHFTLVVVDMMILLFGGLYVAIINLVNHPLVFVQIILSQIGICFGYYCFTMLFKEIKFIHR